MNKTTIASEPHKPSCVHTREFDAPRELAFRACTDLMLYAGWLGPRRHTMTLMTFEPGNGGSWPYIHTDKDGNEDAFRGVDHQVLAPERIISTLEFEGLPEAGQVMRETDQFEALPGGRTKLTTRAVYQSVDDRDGKSRSGMEEAVKDSYERLDELLAQLG